MASAGKNDRTRSVYRNTVIFAVVAALVTIVLLVIVLAVPGGSNFRLAFITVDIGLLAIIINAVVQIARENTRVEELLRDASNARISVARCPAYHTTSQSNGRTICKNAYSPVRDNAVFKFVRPCREEDDDCDDYVELPDVDLSSIDGKTAGQVCETVNTTDKIKHPDDYYRPWTELRAKCASIRENL